VGLTAPARNGRSKSALGACRTASSRRCNASSCRLASPTKSMPQNERYIYETSSLRAVALSLCLGNFMGQRPRNIVISGKRLEHPRPTTITPVRDDRGFDRAAEPDRPEAGEHGDSPLPPQWRRYNRRASSVLGRHALRYSTRGAEAVSGWHRQTCLSDGGTEGSNPSPSSGESDTNLTSSIRAA
jgi:hypothetical protein